MKNMHLLYHTKVKNEKNIGRGSAIGVLSLFMLFGSFLGTVDAASTGETVKAKKLIQSASDVELAPLQKIQATIGFKNTGKFKWSKKTISYIELRASVRGESYLHAPTWKSGFIVKELFLNAKPGEMMYVMFDIEAPRTQGVFRETFALYVSGKKISGTDAMFTIHVLDKKIKNILTSTVTDIAIAQKQEASPPLPSTRAIKLVQSASFLTLSQYQTTSFTVGYKNTGTDSWILGVTPLTIRSLVKKESYFHHASWISGNIMGAVSQHTQPGEVAYFTGILEAPYAVGEYQENFALFIGDVKISGTEFSLPITVIKSPALLVSAPLQPQQESQAQPQAQYMLQPSNTPVRTGIVDDIQEQEKNIRVGIVHARDPILITANAPYEIRDGAGTLLSTEESGFISTVTFDFLQKIYSAVTSKGIITSQSLFRFQGSGSTQNHGQLIAAGIDNIEVTPPLQYVSSTPDGSSNTTQQSSFSSDIVFEILSFVNHPTWSSSLNDNKYRTMLEIRYVEKTDKLWIINDLPLEQYLKGIAETSNNAPYEYQKTMTIAARTYAKYHIDRSTKYADEQFTVRTTDADQVYRGYNSEIRLPKVSRAVLETRGVMVFYNNALAITPYYSQSDGRTRNWEEVWGGGPKPWLVSKDDPACKGLPLLGHGVGISARGAVAMALEGKTAEEILTYYYTGIELHKRY